MAKYNKKMALEMAEIYALGKAKVEEICAQFGIVKDTFYAWQKSKPEFSDAIEHYRAIRRQNIGEMALNGLELLLTKHEYEEVKTDYETYKDPVSGQEKLKVVTISKTKKFVMPSPAMVKFALTNIKDKEYKESSHIDHTTKGESLGFGNFLQKTKPKEGSEEEPYVPDHREDYVPEATA